jgi:long-chain acyl-CoA synthetase
VRISYKKLYEEVLLWSFFFKQFTQKIICVILPNSVDYLKVLFSANLTRNIFNPIPYFVEIQELNKVFKYVCPEVIVTDRDDIIKTYENDYSIIDTRVVDLKEAVPDDALSFKSVESDIAALYYSSGTTGNPKGVLYSNKNMVSLIGSIVREFGFDSKTSHLAFLPFGHTASINYNILPAFYCGASLYISRGFECLRTSFFKMLSKYNIGYTEVIPTVVFMLNKLNLKTGNLNLKNLRFIGCGSSTLPLSAQKEFIDKYKIPLANLYGLSETGPSHIDNPSKEGWEPGSIGYPLDVNECKISDGGEILLKGDNVFVGYYKNKELYKEVVRDGWFYTGDLGYVRNKKFYFADRKKDLIVKGGINIIPMEIEEIIFSIPEVHETVVVGKDHKMLGEKIVAVVTLKENAGDNNIKGKIKEVCKKSLSNYKVPEEIYVWDSIPKTHSGKLLRKKVREEINKES